MIFLLALRNALRNKRNSVIVTLLVGAITALFFLGNSVFARSNRGLRQSYVENLTGDIIIEKKGDVTMNLFGANAPVIENYFTIPTLGAYDEITRELGRFPEIQAFTGQVSTACYIDALDYRSYTLLCGVDAASYFDMFPGIKLLEGRFLQAGEYGAMITRSRADQIEKASGRKLEIGTPVLLTSAGQTGFKIREVPLTGIFSYTARGQFLDEIMIADVQTARVLAAIQVATSDVEPSAEQIRLLDSGIDELFSEELFSEEPDADDRDRTALEDALERFFGEDNGALGGEISAAGGGDWNFIIIRLKQGASAVRVTAELNRTLRSYDAMALGWRFAAGGSAIMLLLLQALFNAGIALVWIAGVIAIINIMLIAVFRRSREIGTLRAIGASDGYIRLIILCENSIIGLLAGIAGVVAGSAVMRIVNGLRMTIDNELVAGLLGGDILAVDFSPAIALASIAAALALSAAASVYPIETAVRIQPVAAMRD
ncbi:MAG: FtsX-like permease family protein [Spirochaetaceae bacterium]|nr:FtsX-like permease family protein [Spirochaetaceae bacterium]